MVKGTPTKGKKMHPLTIKCRRCGHKSRHKKTGICSKCGYGKTSKVRKYKWQKKRSYMVKKKSKKTK